MRNEARLTGTFLSWCFCGDALDRPASAYSLLTHEQLIDLTWKESIVPLLLSRYPALTPAQLDEARAYAYGGCVIQDIGYYPFGDMSFSNLTHYVRSGDFVVNLFRNAQNANELAFAVGALSHYVGDSIGHSQATNLAVPIEFPKLRAKYGPTVNYAEGNTSTSRRSSPSTLTKSRITAWRRSAICAISDCRYRCASLPWPTTRPTDSPKNFTGSGAASMFADIVSRCTLSSRALRMLSRFCIAAMSPPIRTPEASKSRKRRGLPRRIAGSLTAESRDRDLCPGRISVHCAQDRPSEAGCRKRPHATNRRRLRS